MNKKLMTAMTASISEVMETMFFIPVETEENQNTGKPGLSGKTHSCRLTFKGDMNGAFVICVPENLLGEMTCNFLGEDPANLSEELLNGTLKEMLNMVCGNALKRFESSLPYELGIPKVIETPDLSLFSDLITVQAEDKDMAILLELENN